MRFTVDEVTVKGWRTGSQIDFEFIHWSGASGGASDPEMIGKATTSYAKERQTLQ